ncbi:alpha/beta hydrolase [Mycetocola sp. 2940]|uniref:alpha/beta hydrolase n=1 Tax=Mycetocola sp. 2940 TaxID=3156452 RepID=UPI00339817B0
MTAYVTSTVPVDGGDLTVGIWNPDAQGTAVVALHGITASHLAWQTVAERMPGVRVIAPDLRGRGRSNKLPAPYGMDRHADDVAAIVDRFGLTRPLVAGHSMGAFVAMQAVRRHPGRIGGVVLIDGGLPLETSAQSPAEAIAVLGPAAERLSMTFPSRQAYLEFWRRHPAFAEDWTPATDAYVDYDLDGTEPELRPATKAEAMLEDSLWLAGDDAWVSDVNAWGAPIPFLVAPRGLMNEPVGLYPREAVTTWSSLLPGLSVIPVEHVNHYTILMSEKGAGAVRTVILAEQSRISAAYAATEVQQ